MKYPTEFAPQVTTVNPSSDSKGLRSRGLYVCEGLDTIHAQELIMRSQEKHVFDFCPNDSAKRFASIENIKRWLAQGRQAYPLIRIGGGEILKLVGFGWMGPGAPGENEPDVPGAEITFGIRLYEDALGQGNALPYTQAMLANHGERYGNNGVWLETWGDNSPAVRTYEKAGFQKVAESLDIRHGELHPRLYMALGNLATR